MKRKPYACVMEAMVDGTLATLLHSTRELSWQDRMPMVKEIAKAVHVLHSHDPPVSYLVFQSSRQVKLIS